MFARVVHREIDQQPRAVARSGVPVHLLKLKIPQLRMAEEFQLIFHAAHVIALVPQSFELCGDSKEARQLRFPLRFAAMLGHCRAEVGDENRQYVIAFAESASPRRMGEKEVDAVTIFRRNGVEIHPHQMTKTVVPRHDVEVRFLDAGRFRHQRIQQTPRAFADPLTHGLLRRFARRQSRQHKQMARFRGGALQGFRHRHHDGAGGIDVPALLKPGVPGHPHIRQHRHLFTTQPRRAAPTAARQAQPLGIKAFAART
ncbi:hypothetical protein D3C72_1041600 [compost metagenome]